MGHCCVPMPLFPIRRSRWSPKHWRPNMSSALPRRAVGLAPSHWLVASHDRIRLLFTTGPSSWTLSQSFSSGVDLWIIILRRTSLPWAIAWIWPRSSSGETLRAGIMFGILRPEVTAYTNLRRDARTTRALKAGAHSEFCPKTRSPC